MYYRSYWVVLAIILVWFGWKMLSENWRSLSKREGMFDKGSSETALLSAIPMIFLGGAILLLGLGYLAFRIMRLIL